MSPIAETVQGYRLSPQQKRLWAVQSRQGKVAWAGCLIRLKGPLQAERLRTALQETLQSREILRTAYPLADGLSLPVQSVREQAALQWREEDRRQTGSADRQSSLIETPPDVDLGAQPGIRAVLIRLGEEDWQLQLCLPSLSADARTLVNLVDEVGRRYSGQPLDEEALPYAQFAEWQNELQRDEDEEGAAAREFWRGLNWEGLDWELPFQRSLGAPAPLRAPEPLRLEFDGVEEEEGRQGWRRSGGVTIEANPGAPPSLAALHGTQALREAADRMGASLESFLLAGWQALLWRLTGRSGLLLGWCCPGRHYEVLESAYGLLSRHLPLACRFPAGRGFDEAVAAAAESAQQASGFQEYFDWKLSGAEDEASTLLTAGFQFLDWPEGVWADGLTCRCLDWQAPQEPMGLLLSASDFGSSLQIGLEYDSGRLAPEDAQCLLDCLAALLEDAAARPQAPVEGLQLLDPAQARRLLVELNQTSLQEETFGSIALGFRLQSQRTPDRAALEWADAVLSFAALQTLAEGLAGRLIGLGAGPESVVGLIAERSGETIAGLLGILLSGSAYLPLDPTDPAQRLAGLLQESSACAVVAGPAHRDLIPPEKPMVWFDSIAAAARDTGILPVPRSSFTTQEVQTPLQPANLAYLLYTSGSTGRPKGVMVTHRGAVNLLAALRRTVYQGFPAPLRVSQNAPLAFDASVKQILQLLDGHTLRVVPDEVRLQAKALQSFLQECRIDVLDVTPTQLQMLFESGWPAGPHSFPRLLLSGGEPLTMDQWARLASLDAQRAFNVYGPTECTVDATACPVQAGLNEPLIGGPLANTRVFVLDPRLQPLPQGAAGELCVSGLGVARGYWRNPSWTARRFVPDLFSGIPGQRLYRTGDLAVMRSDGQIRLLGRIDHQVKLRGLRIELGEIESALLQHPQVLQAVAAVRDDLDEGQGLAAYVRLSKRLGAASAELRGFLRRRLPEYMVPSAWVVLDELPLNRNGKVDRKALPTPAATGASETPYAPPGNETELLLAEIWQEVLQVKRVGVEDNFFDLGGHSLLMIQVHARLLGLFGRQVTIVDLFRHPCIRDLAAFLEGPAEHSAAVQQAGERARRQVEALQRRRQTARQRRAHG